MEKPCDTLKSPEFLNMVTDTPHAHQLHVMPFPKINCGLFITNPQEQAATKQSDRQQASIIEMALL